jgi:hypothetical protein
MPSDVERDGREMREREREREREIEKYVKTLNKKRFCEPSLILYE